MHPNMFFQTDEIDGMVQSINKAKDARHESIMNTLLSLVLLLQQRVRDATQGGQAGSRRDRSAEPGGVRHRDSQPLLRSLVRTHAHQRLLCTARSSPSQVRAARDKSRASSKISSRVRTTAKWWADFRPGTGNLAELAPDAGCCRTHGPSAGAIGRSAHVTAEAEYAKAESSAMLSARPSGDA